MTADLRWFAPNRFCAMVLPALRDHGFRIETEGDRPAHLAVALDGQVAVAGYEYARRHGVPLLLYLWDLPPWRLGAGRPDVIFEWRRRVRRVPRIVGGFPERPGYYSRIRFIARRAAAVWVPSAATGRDVADRFGVRPEVVPYCYDSDRFTAEQWRPAVPPRLLCVSRLVPHKNQAAVIRAAAKLAPVASVRLIGQGPDAEALRALAAGLGVPLTVESDWPSDEAVRAAYREATVVIAPSRFEGFGLTPMEGIASGVPTVASDIPPHREFLGDAATFFTLEDDLSLVVAVRMAMERGPADPDAVGGLRIGAAAGRIAAGLARLGVTPR